jgi:tetratricopeptide (TPR) repeat protein
MSAFERLIEKAWSTHGDNPRAATAKLEAALSEATTEADVESAARFLFHVYGVHFGEWEAGAARLRGLRNSPAWSKLGAAERAISRSLRALELARGDEDAELNLGKLPESDAVHAYAQAAQCLMERGDDARAMDYLQRAVARSDALAPELAQGCARVLAITGNNIATGYEEWPMMDEAQRERMVVAAHIGRMYWERAGTWLEVERAEYRLAKCMLIAGYAPLAVKHAQSCIRICEDNAAPALEFFFGIEALTLALVAQGEYALVARLQEKAHRLYDELSADDQQWCAPTLRSIQAIERPPESARDANT